MAVDVVGSGVVPAVTCNKYETRLIHVAKLSFGILNAAHIRNSLSVNFRCLYLNSVAKGSLILSDDPSPLKNGQFDMESMLEMLEEKVNRALNDGYKGLWAMGDMSWEMGPDRNVQRLLEYEWKPEKL